MATQYIEEFGSVGQIPAHIGSGRGGKYGIGVVSGIPYLGSNPLSIERRYGNAWFVNASATGNGDNTNNDGKSWAAPFLTMAKAFSSVGTGDVIYFVGNVTEQLETPALISDVTIVGAGNRPRHADSHPPGTDAGAATWRAPGSPAAATPLVRVNQPGWRFFNILFAGPTDNSVVSASIELFRDGAADAVEKNASHTEIVGCRFASGTVHIHDTGGCYNVSVRNCIFVHANLWSILGVGNIGVGQSEWEIFNCHFDSDAVAAAGHVKIAGFACVIKGNHFDDGGNPNTTVVLNTNNGGGANNFVVENYFQTLDANFNSPDIVAPATDMWANNYVFDDEEVTGFSS